MDPSLDDSRTPDPEINALNRLLATMAGFPQRENGHREIAERSILALVSESTGALADGVAARWQTSHAWGRTGRS